MDVEDHSAQCGIANKIFRNKLIGTKDVRSSPSMKNNTISELPSYFVEYIQTISSLLDMI